MTRSQGATVTNTTAPNHDRARRRRRLRAPSPAMLVALIALFVAMGGTGYAATRLLPRNSVGEHQLRKSAVTGSKIRPHTVHLSDIATSTRSSLRGQTGPQGRQGPQGPAGPQGPPGPGAGIFLAAVNSGAVAVRGNALGVSGAGGSGTYTIRFASDVSSCETTATLASVPGGSVVDPPPGRITVRPVDTRVEVHTYDVDGSVRDLPFNVIVVC
jgi:hypothetical protein